MGLQNTSVADLDSTIRCAADTGHAIPVDELRQAIDAESTGSGPRKSIIKLLEREIKRQERTKVAE